MSKRNQSTNPSDPVANGHQKRQFELDLDMLKTKAASWPTKTVRSVNA